MIRNINWYIQMPKFDTLLPSLLTKGWYFALSLKRCAFEADCIRDNVNGFQQFLSFDVITQSTKSN